MLAEAISVVDAVAADDVVSARIWKDPKTGKWKTVKPAAADLKNTDSIPSHFDYRALGSETLEAIREREAFLATEEPSRFDNAVDSIDAFLESSEAKGILICHLNDIQFPFTDWQNDLHLIVGTAQRHFLCLRPDLAKLVAAATRAFSGAHSIGSVKIGAGMFAAESYTSRHYIAIVAMACLCVLLGGPSYAAGAESLIIAGATYCEPGVSGPGWAWTDADHLELNGYAGEAIGAEGDLVLTLAGQNSVTESHAPDADITLCGMEVWGNLTLRGTGALTATGSQCGIHVSQALVVDGCTVDSRADGADITDEAVAGVIAGGMAVRGGGNVFAAGAGSGTGVRAYGVYLQDAGLGNGAAGCRLTVDASWLDAAGADGGVACTGGSLESARFVAPAGGAFGASGVLDVDGAVALHVVVEPDVVTPPAGENDGPDVPGSGTGEPDGGAGPAAEQPGTEPTTVPAMKPAATSPKTNITTKTRVTKTTVPAPSKPKATSATAATLPKTGDSNWIAVSFTFFLLATVLLATACRR